MVDNKYIGLAMAIVGSFAIGTSSVITKMGLTASADGTASTDNMAFLRNSVWWAGMGALVVGEVANFGAYTFAPPIMVTPLGALSVIVAAVFASFLLNERLGHLGRVGCILCILGSSIIVLHAPEDQELETVTQFLEYAVEPSFLLYCFTVLIFSLIMAYGVAPRHGRTNPLVYISIASLVGGVSVMFVKGFTVALKLTFSGENQFVYPSTYLFVVIAGVCIVVQLNYANKALDLFSVNLVNPIYYVGFCTATIVASLILFKGFNTTSASSTVSLLSGFIITFLGVYILNLAMLDESEAASRAASNVSLGGGVSPWTHGHARRNSSGSLNGLRTPLFGAFAIEAEPGSAASVGFENVRLERLDEEEGEYGEDVDETTALHVGGLGSSSSSRGGSRRASPLPRISPRPV
ncbi:magnesium transporter NIPA-domain-containing protein [Mycena rosella]|uniref:Magnesium transporter NIPA-domain-containing protein n=1 Tax=Mycena rosella TaxID=1033263 RepID=A0AAD7DDZ0_MYCRO|nr:magnesium transporter NIPA-domain-containing protein [Mycena rosella]